MLEWLLEGAAEYLDLVEYTPTHAIVPSFIMGFDKPDDPNLL